jgi:hypothetical protein
VADGCCSHDKRRRAAARPSLTPPRHGPETGDVLISMQRVYQICLLIRDASHPLRCPCVVCCRNGDLLQVGNAVVEQGLSPHVPREQPGIGENNHDPSYRQHPRHRRCCCGKMYAFPVAPVALPDVAQTRPRPLPCFEDEGISRIKRARALDVLLIAALLPGGTATIRGITGANDRAWYLTGLAIPIAREFQMWVINVFCDPDVKHGGPSREKATKTSQ